MRPKHYDPLAAYNGLVLMAVMPSSQLQWVEKLLLLNLGLQPVYVHPSVLDTGIQSVGPRSPSEEGQMLLPGGTYEVLPRQVVERLPDGKDARDAYMEALLSYWIPLSVTVTTATSKVTFKTEVGSLFRVFQRKEYDFAVGQVRVEDIVLKEPPFE